LTGDLLIFIWTRKSVVDMEKVYIAKKVLCIWSYCPLVLLVDLLT
jgi:hypothetical protein